MFSKILDILFPPSAREHRVRALTTLEADAHVYDTAAGVRVTSCAAYGHGDVKAAVTLLKRRPDAHAAGLLANLLADVLTEELADDALWNNTKVLIVPLPLARRRQRERGFNQVERVCDALPEELRALVSTDVLKRVHNTRSQNGLSRAQRLENVAGAFALAHAPAPDTHIILVDDVVTTGATLKAARDALVAGGCSHISLIALARA